jgi:hypothetical protein
MGKSTISMAIFNSFLYVYQAGYPSILDVPPVAWPQDQDNYHGFIRRNVREKMEQASLGDL